MPFQPIGDRYLLEFIWQKETAGGILLPEKSEQINLGKVIAVGDGILDDGMSQQMVLKDGDVVLFLKVGSVEVFPKENTDPKRRFFAVSQSKIVGKFI